MIYWQLPNAAQEVFDLHCCQGTLLNCTQPAVHKDSWDNFCKVASLLWWCVGLFFPGARFCTLPMPSFMRFLLAHFSHFQVPPDGSTALWCISYSLQCQILCRLGESTLKMKSSNSTDPWGTSHSWPPDGFCSANHNPLCPALQPPFRASQHSSTLSLFHRLSKEDEWLWEALPNSR